MAQMLSPVQRQELIAAGYDASEVDSWSICKCGSGEPTMYVLRHSPVCGWCWIEDQEL